MVMRLYRCMRPDQGPSVVLHLIAAKPAAFLMSNTYTHRGVHAEPTVTGNTGQNELLQDLNIRRSPQPGNSRDTEGTRDCERHSETRH